MECNGVDPSNPPYGVAVYRPDQRPVPNSSGGFGASGCRSSLLLSQFGLQLLLGLVQNRGVGPLPAGVHAWLHEGLPPPELLPSVAFLHGTVFPVGFKRRNGVVHIDRMVHHGVDPDGRLQNGRGGDGQFGLRKESCGHQ